MMNCRFRAGIFGIAGGEVGAGELQVHHRLLDGFALGVGQAAGGRTVARAEAFVSSA